MDLHFPKHSCTQNALTPQSLLAVQCLALRSQLLANDFAPTSALCQTFPFQDIRYDKVHHRCCFCKEISLLDKCSVCPPAAASSKARGTGWVISKSKREGVNSQLSFEVKR